MVVVLAPEVPVELVGLMIAIAAVALAVKSPVITSCFEYYCFI